MKTALPIILFSLLYSIGVSAQEGQLFEKKPLTATAYGQEEYTIVYYLEGYRWNSVAITYPDGTGKNDSKKFKYSESPRFGNYSWFMPFLNELISEGYSIKSHTMSAQLNEESNVRIHLYIMARPIRPEVNMPQIKKDIEP